MDSLQSLVAEEYMKLRVVKVMEEKMGLNMADTLTNVRGWAAESLTLTGLVE